LYSFRLITLIPNPLLGYGLGEGLVELKIATTQDHPDLYPTPISQRTIGSFTYTVIILSMAITTSIFFLGWLSQILGLSLVQALVAALIGNLVALIMTLNGWVFDRDMVGALNIGLRALSSDGSPVALGSTEPHAVWAKLVKPHQGLAQTTELRLTKSA